MSITLLEITVAIILLVVAWQIGVAISPWIIGYLRGLKRDLDEVAEEIVPDQTEQLTPHSPEETRTNHKYRNN